MTQPQGQNPLSYVGVKATNPADVIQAQRAPTSADVNYPIGTFWIDIPNADAYQLTQISGGAATWKN